MPDADMQRAGAMPGRQRRTPQRQRGVGAEELVRREPRRILLRCGLHIKRVEFGTGLLHSSTDAAIGPDEARAPEHPGVSPARIPSASEKAWRPNGEGSEFIGRA